MNTEIRVNKFGISLVIGMVLVVLIIALFNSGTVSAALYKKSNF